MNIIYSLVFPAPKLNWSIKDFKSELIHIPIFNRPIHYDIYKSNFIKKDIWKNKLIKNNNNLYEFTLNEDYNLFENYTQKNNLKNVKNNNKFKFNPRTSHDNLFHSKKNKYFENKKKYDNLFEKKFSLTNKKIKSFVEKEIPCLFLESPKPCKSILIYFHANSEDIGLCYYFLNLLRSYLKINILAVEYPNYSIYKNKESITPKLVNEDALKIVEFLNYCLDIEFSDMILLGRSIGTGPVSFLTNKIKFGFCVLISPFTSIKKVISEFKYVGFLGKYWISKNDFKNKTYLKNSKNNWLIIHGKKDNIIHYSHSEKLLNLLNNEYSQLLLFNDIDHNNFDPIHFIIIPILKYMKKINFKNNPGSIDFPSCLKNNLINK